MEILFIILFIIILITIIGVFIYITNWDFKEYIIRINECEANIESTLNKRFDLLNKSNDVIRTITAKEGEILKTISKIRSQKLNNYELDRELYKAIEEFHEYALNYKQLKDNDDYTKIEIDLIESEAEIVSLKKYYNDIANKYNKLASKFPSSMVAKIKKYSILEEYDSEEHLDLINSLK